MSMKVGIVGGGLSGTLLSWHLIQRGVEVVLFDNNQNYSSKVAAGMINPLVFRRMTKSWRLDEFMPFLSEFYKELEMETNVSFFHEVTIRRFFSSLQEKNYWLKRQSTPEFSPYMEEVTPDDEIYFPEANVFGSGRVKQSHYVDTRTFLSAMHSFLSTRVKIEKEDFDFKCFNEKEVSYKGEKLDKLIFCEGYKGLENPLFSYLPLTQTKGETLTVTLTHVPENESLNRKCFVLPLGEKKFKIGSTYVWDTADLSLTEQGRKDILHNLTFLTKEEPKLLLQQAGIRPTTVDRRPLMGEHPVHKNVFVFNGLGAKGYMLAPLLTKEMVEYILDGVALNKEVDIVRCLALFQQKEQ